MPSVSDWMGSGATVILAGLTYGYLRETRRLANSTAVQAEAAREQAQMAQRPSLALDASLRQPADGRARAELGQASGQIVVPLTNVGLGTARIESAGVELGDRAIGAFEPPLVAPFLTTALTITVKRGDTAAWQALEALLAGPNPSLDVRVAYCDIARAQHQTLRARLTKGARGWSAEELATPPRAGDES